MKIRHSRIQEFVPDRSGNEKLKFVKLKWLMRMTSHVRFVGLIRKRG
jgi:hypothetical protein